MLDKRTQEEKGSAFAARALVFAVDNSPQESASAVLINRAVSLTKSKKRGIQIMSREDVHWLKTGICRVFRTI